MDDWEEYSLEIASFRYRVIAEALEAEGKGVRAALVSAAAREYVNHRGRTVQINVRTLWRWLAEYRSAGLNGLCPKRRKDAGKLRALPAATLDRAVKLRRENQGSRATRSVIDILERLEIVEKRTLKRSTLDGHFARLGVSRHQLGSLGKQVFMKIDTSAVLELVVIDFHYGPYVRVGDADTARRSLLLAFIDHFSRYVLEGRYYLHEDFAALRFGFRRLLIVYGPCAKIYADNGGSFQSGRFHAACKNEAIDIQLVHSKAYAKESRGVIERFNRTLKEQFETEVRHRPELLTLDELNAFFAAWLAERYHRDINSETNEPPHDRFWNHVTRRPAPDLARIDELLRLRKQARVHKKWSTVEVQTVRYVVDPSLRGRKVHVLYDTFDPSYVLIEFDGRIVQRAEPQKPGQLPPEIEHCAHSKEYTDYLALLRRDYEARTRAELEALNLRAPRSAPELGRTELQALLVGCRATALSADEHSRIAACFRKMRPIDPEVARRALDSARRRYGTGLHLGVYIDTLETALVRERTKGGKKR